MAYARIRQLSAHEVGHTLGFTHNFAASTYGRGSVMDYPAPLIEIKNGKLDVTKFETKSADGELHVDFDATLNQDILQSTVAGCLRFSVTEVLTKREPKTASAISLTGAPRGPDNLFHIKLEGPLREVRRLALVCGAAASRDTPGGVPTRPNLTVTPDQPVRPSGAIGIPPPTMPPPAAAPPPPQGGVFRRFLDGFRYR